MAASDVAGVSGNRRAISAVLFLSAGMYTMDAMSTLNSSPWTSENFGADPEKAASARRYVWHAIAVGNAYCLVSAIIAGSIWPIAGAVANDAYLWWVYDAALKRGAAAGSTGWLRS